jgi:hypothetical protein
MNERVFRFDTIVAVCALLISCVAAVASVYQTRVFRDQYAATIWPYLSVDDTTNVSSRTKQMSSMDVTLTNNGLGPALIRSARLSVAGKDVLAWNELRDLIERDQGKNAMRMPAQMASVDASTTIRPGDSRRVFAVTLVKGIPVSKLVGLDITVDLCYCSLNDRCWNVQTKIGHGTGTYPHAVDRCAVGPRIDSRSV